MPNYCVNSNVDSRGRNHEVHRLDQHTRYDGSFGFCRKLPKPENRISLDYHSGCHSAVAEAKRDHFSNSDECYWCSRECHNG